MKWHVVDSILVRFILPVALVGFGLAAETTYAQPMNPNFQLRLTGGLLPFGGTLESEVRLDNFEPVSGWIYSVTYDDYRLALVSLASGPGLATVLGGGPPDFEILQDLSFGLYQHAVTISSAPPIGTIPTGLNRLLSVATYEPFAGVTGDTFVDFTTPTTVSDVQTQAFTPVTTGATITVVDAVDPQYQLFFDAPTLEPGNNEVRVLLTNTGDSLAGWSYGAGFGESPLMVELVETGAATLIANGGNPPDFEVFNSDDFSFSQAVVVSSMAGVGLPPGLNLELAVVTVFVPQGFEGDYTIRFEPAFGTPVVVVPLTLGINITPETIPLCLTTNHSFDRGDCNDDGAFTIADAVFGLEVVFMGGTPNCADACDSNDNEEVDMVDPIHSLNALFNGGPPPPGSGTCAMDPGPGGFGDLACFDASACP